MTGPRLSLQGGGTAEIRITDGSSVTLRSTHPSPPGSMLSGKSEATGVTYRVKVRGCRRLAEEGDFEIHGRILDLTRPEREALLRLCAEKK